jgi:hypothetical protein
LKFLYRLFVGKGKARREESRTPIEKRSLLAKAALAGMAPSIGDEKLDREDFSLATESQLDRFSDVYRSGNHC